MITAIVTNTPVATSGHGAITPLNDHGHEFFSHPSFSSPTMNTQVTLNTPTQQDFLTL